MNKQLIAVAMMAPLIFPGCHRDDGAEDPALVENRLWVDHLPADDRDMIEVFAALSDENSGIGIFQTESVWKGSFEIFTYEGHGGELRVAYPQSGKKETVRARASHCNQAEMDYCLSVKGGRGAKRYYSQIGWEIDSLAQVQAKVRTLARQQ